MKINQPKIDHQQLSQRLLEVEDLIEAMQSKGQRPCPGCTRPCPCSGSTDCDCECSYSCTQAASQLSSEKERYPIEQKVLPLVFTLRAMNVCEPCWSCQGHLDKNQQIEKIPQVWFYTGSLSLIRLLDESLGIFKAKKLLKYTWQVTASYTSRDCVINAFSLKPDLNSEKLKINKEKADKQDLIRLQWLQQDLKTLAEHIESDLYKRSISYQSYLRGMKADEFSVSVKQ